MSTIYDTLNPEQREAVETTEEPLLVLAGAGSGKTRALTHRVAYLIQEKGVAPWHILAITFTNKAAGEMRDRVNSLIGEDGSRVWVATFHATCVRILRRHADDLGYTRSFTIYDSDDQKSLVKQIIKKLDLDPKRFRERPIMRIISAAKNSGLTPDEFRKENDGDYLLDKAAEIYREYQRQCMENNAMDFDDLLLNTVELFRLHPDVLEEYQERFRYILVDEYQDTNTVQFQLVSLLAAKYRNLCVVGDDDQSIYRFRGADIRNILEFEQAFPGAKVLRLEQNYRSTKNILQVANEVIRHNKGRKEKTLWTENAEGPLVSLRQYDTAYDEADGIARDILKNQDRYSFGQCAVLYRTNAQSRILEEKCISYNIPYRLVGGINFYQRKEIKDMICYLKTVNNGRDSLAVERIINVPKRGIGATSINRIDQYAGDYGMSFFDAVCDAEHIPGLGRSLSKVKAFADQIQSLREQAAGLTVRALMEKILEETGYRAELEAEAADLSPEAQSRLENIEEFLNKAGDFGSEAGDPEALSRFLEEVALVADVDSLDSSEERIVLMTLHAAKGLEFPKVYLAGMEDGLFPSAMTIQSDDPMDVEEERRLCYVGITRAREELVLTASRQRMVNGETRYSALSRFVKEIPAGLLQRNERKNALSRSRDNRGDLPGGFEGGRSGWRNGTGSGGGWSSSGAGSSRNSGTTEFRAKPMVTGGAFGVPQTVGKQFIVKKGEKPDYGVGDRVHHKKFGDGTVSALEEGKRDYEVTVNFDAGGEKHLLASFAMLEKL